MTIQRFEFPSALSKMFIGLNLLNDELSDYTPNDNYPPFNIIQNDPDHTTIEMALAGFSPEEIEVTTKNSMLNISTTVEKDDKNDGRNYLHHGLASRSFTRSFKLYDHISVTDAEFNNGVLTVHLERKLPEHLKPKVIEIKTKTQTKTLKG